MHYLEQGTDFIVQPKLPLEGSRAKIIFGNNIHAFSRNRKERYLSKVFVKQGRGPCSVICFMLHDPLRFWKPHRSPLQFDSYLSQAGEYPWKLLSASRVHLLYLRDKLLYLSSLLSFSQKKMSLSKKPPFRPASRFYFHFLVQIGLS